MGTQLRNSVWTACLQFSLEYQGGMNTKQTIHWLHISSNIVRRLRQTGGQWSNWWRPQGLWPGKAKIKPGQPTGTNRFWAIQMKVPATLKPALPARQSSQKNTNITLSHDPREQGPKASLSKPPYQDVWVVYKAETQDQREVVREHLVLFPWETQHCLKWF